MTQNVKFFLCIYLFYYSFNLFIYFYSFIFICLFSSAPRWTVFPLNPWDPIPRPAPSASQVFDTVLCLGGLHCTPDPMGLLRHLWTGLAPGGRLIVGCRGMTGEAPTAAVPPGDGPDAGVWALGACPALRNAGALRGPATGPSCGDSPVSPHPIPSPPADHVYRLQTAASCARVNDVSSRFLGKRGRRLGLRLPASPKALHAHHISRGRSVNANAEQLQTFSNVSQVLAQCTKISFPLGGGGGMCIRLEICMKRA